MAYSREQWEVARIMFEQGKPLSFIVENSEIKDKGTVSRKAKECGWQKGKTQPLLQKEIEARQALAEVEDEKSNFTPLELQLYEREVAERVVLLNFFTEAAVRNTQAALKKMEKAGEFSAFEHKALAETIQKSKETALGKDVAPVAAVQINNHSGEPGARRKMSELSDEELLAIIEG